MSSRECSCGIYTNPFCPIHGEKEDENWPVINAPGAGYDFCSLCGLGGEDEPAHEPGCPNTPNAEDLAQVMRDKQI